MTKPLTDVKDDRFTDEISLMYEAIASSCSDKESCIKILSELLTNSELRMLKRRWYIARLLIEGMDVRSVARKAEVSTTTVVRVSQIIRKEESVLSRLVKEQGGVKKEDGSPEKHSKYSFGTVS